MDDLYIDGVWRAAASGRTRSVIDPADGSTIVEVAEADPSDVRDAIVAARRAFDDSPWPATPVADRSALLRRVADLLQRDKESLAETETRDTGKTLAESRIDIDDVTAVFRYYADLVTTIADRVVDVGDPAVISRVVHEPIGVCVLIAPWNYPLLQISWKVAPALAAGATMVMKPSEVTPLTTIAFTRLLVEAGVPAGVVNLVLGAGRDLSDALIDDPDVDLISFTGGLATGQVIAATAAKHVTRVLVELGGKNPHVVFADACATEEQFAATVDQVVTGVFLHSGQVCSAGTRLIVEESVADRLVAAVAERAERIVVGPGSDPDSRTGPLVSQQQLDKIVEHVASGQAEGARLVTGGRRLDDPDRDDPRLAPGYFYAPTVFDHCDRSMRIVQDETFGPILTVERFTTEAQALELANDTRYGLAGGVRTADPARAERFARGMRHGTVWINDFGYYTPAAEWGGYGRSGNGRELGPSGLAEYQETKHIWNNTAAPTAGWFEA